ncbi:pilus assembly PilX N-terminal domain-containing protein [Chloroflexota bacterium]
MKANIAKCFREESGQALISVLIFLLIGSLTLPPVLSHIGTALKSEQVYESKTDALYAADSGIEDAIWQVKYNRLEALLNDPVYDAYDFDTTWSYNLSELINDLTANVTIQNVWIPKGVTQLSPAEARATIESNKLIVAGTATTDTNYRIKVDFYPGTGEENSLMVESLGIWLPLGHSYVADSSNLEEDPFEEFYSVPTVSDYAGGEAVVWEFSPPVDFADFPGVSVVDVPMTTEISFEYTSAEAGVRPVAISWIETSGVSDVPLSWDIDTKIFQITSTAGDTTIEAYASRCELRQMAAAIAGDYKAIGNSLMVFAGSPDGRRDTVLSESSTTLTAVPNGDPEDDVGDVLAAYLYWSGSCQGSFSTPIWGADTCGNFDNWTNSAPNTVWQISSGRFRGRYTGSDQDARYLEMTGSVDLTAYSEGEAIVEWDQDESSTMESTDGLTFQISGDNGTSWSDPITAFYDDIVTPDYSEAYFYYIIPEAYLTSLFKVKVHLEDCVDEYMYLDDIAVAEITAAIDTTAHLKMDDVQVYLDGNGDPQIGIQDLTATTSAAIAFEKPDEYAYSCYIDITKLVQEYSEEVEDEWGGECKTGNAKYTVGGVDADTGEYRSYAGWSIIIVYSSPETAGHQLYLYDTFAINPGQKNLDFDFDGEPGGDITGFVVPEAIEGEEVAATLTCFVGEGDSAYDGDYLLFNDTELSDGAGDTDDVWDSESIGMSEPGVDVDTFTIEWDDVDPLGDPVISADDTEAHIDLPTESDNWVLIYMILSVRSETITGGTVHYVIHSN